MKIKKQPIDYTLLKPITLEEAKALEWGQFVYLRDMGKPVRARVNGQVKTWKRSPERVQVPLKHGLYEFGYLTESNLERFSLESEPKRTVEMDVHGYIWVAPTNQDPNYVISCFVDFVTIVQPSAFKEDETIQELIEDFDETHGTVQWGDSIIDRWTTSLGKYAPEGYIFGQASEANDGASGDWGYWPLREDE